MKIASYIAGDAFHFKGWRTYYAGIGQRQLPTAMVAILIATISLWLSACGSGADSKRFTQCFKPFDEPFGRAQEFYRDEKRRCYGLRWNVPRAYYFASLGDGPLGQNFILAIPVGKLQSYTSAPSGERQKIKVISLFGDFNKRAQEIRRAVATLPGVHKTEKLFHGLDVYAKKPSSPVSQEFFLLVPRDPAPQLLIEVWARPGQALSQLPEQHPFEIVANVDDRVYIEYRLPRSQLPQLEAINAEIVALVRSFTID